MKKKILSVLIIMMMFLIQLNANAETIKTYGKKVINGVLFSVPHKWKWIEESGDGIENIFRESDEGSIKISVDDISDDNLNDMSDEELTSYLDKGIDDFLNDRYGAYKEIEKTPLELNEKYAVKVVSETEKASDMVYMGIAWGKKICVHYSSNYEYDDQRTQENFKIANFVIESIQKYEKPYDFRETNWGMTKEEVTNIEGEPIEASEESLLYSGTAAGKDVLILYSFQEDALMQGTLFFEGDHVNKNLYYNDYIDLVEIYSEKYGTPDQKEDWNDDLYKDDPTEWGTAIAAGHVIFASRWITNTTEITIVLQGDNFEVSLGALYTDRNYEPKANTDGI